MTNLVSFNFENVTEINTIIKDEKIHFHARAIASALGYKDEAQAYKTHCKSLILFNSVELTESNFPNPHPRGEYFILEPDVYRLIIKSNKPEAERFEKWLFEEVLPSIRKTGSYSINNRFNENSLTEINKAIALILQENASIRNQLNLVLDELVSLRPKVEAFDLIVENKDAYSMEEASKLLNQQFRHLNLKYLSRNTLLDTLRKAGVLNYKNIAYQNHINSGNFMYKYSEIVDIQGKSKQYISSTLVTSTGLNYCIGILKQYNILPTILYPKQQTQTNLIPVLHTNTTLQ